MSQNVITKTIEDSIIEVFKTISFKQSTDEDLRVNEFEISPSEAEVRGDYFQHRIKIHAIFEHKKYNEIFKNSRFKDSLFRNFLVLSLIGNKIDKKRIMLELVVMQAQSC